MRWWRYHPATDTWTFHSDEHLAFECPLGMVATVLDVCKFDDETEKRFVDAALDFDGPLLGIKRRGAEKLLMRRQNGSTLTEEEESAAFEFAADSDLFTLSDSGVFEIWMGDDEGIDGRGEV